ncbi:MAG TPA: hypothetical protein VHA56_18760 [Mucilaginibacter sp.]|nr:hypothetical protein [Mucilaginibacter sp.]
MDYQISPVSGNSFLIRLIPATPDEEKELTKKDNEKLLADHYRLAIRQKFGEDTHLASLTPDKFTPSIAMVELFNQSGSV